MGEMQAVGRSWGGVVTGALRSKGLGDRAGMQGSLSHFNSTSLQAGSCLWTPTPSTKAGHPEMEKISPCP